MMIFIRYLYLCLRGRVAIVLAIVISVLCVGCVQTPERLPQKVIETHAGEVTSDVRFVGERLHFRIYYSNDSRQSADVVITDVLDLNLLGITVHNGGSYDASTRMITWSIAAVPPNVQGSVNFEADVGEVRSINNQALVRIGSARPIATNEVKAKVCSPPRLGWVPFEERFVAQAPARSYMKGESTTNLLVNFDIPGMYAQEVQAGGATYHRLSIPGYASSYDIGNPELPVIGAVVEIPSGVNVKFDVVKSNSTDLSCYNVYPHQRPEVRQDGESTNPSFNINTATYLKDVYQPSTPIPITATDIGVVRGHRLMFLKVYPIQYNPATRALRAFSNIEISVTYDKPAQIAGIDPRLNSTAFENLLQPLVLNYKTPSRLTSLLYENAGDWSVGCDYLIITHSKFYDKNDPKNPITRLAEWKRKKGLVTRIVETADIGNGSAKDIRNFIQKAYKNWNPAPTYVLLVGDTGDDTGQTLVPTNYWTPHKETKLHYGTKTGTDLYYAAVHGNDYFPDLLLGRLPVDNVKQASAVIDKILTYERTPPSKPDFYKSVPLVSVFNDNNNDGQEDQLYHFIGVMEEVKNYLSKDYQPQRIYTKISKYPQGPQKFENGTSLPAYLKLPSFKWNGSKTHISNAVNSGSFLLHFLTHGWRPGISHPSFRESDALALTNTNLTPVLISYGCSTAWFDNETDDDGPVPNKYKTSNKTESFSEHFLRHDKGGAVAIIGATRSNYMAGYQTLGVYEAMWPQFDPKPPIKPDPEATGQLPKIKMAPLRRMGQIHVFSKIYLASHIHHGPYRKTDFEVGHLLGDPEMPVWTRQPAKLKVSHPEGIGSTGVQDFVVKVVDASSNKVIAGTAVALTRGGSLLASQHTNAGGIARFTFKPTTVGAIDITVTGENYAPYEGRLKSTVGGAVLNYLNPDNSIVNQDVQVGGQSFLNEQVSIAFDNQSILSVHAQGGSFGQTGAIKFKVPASQPLGPVNVLSRGNNSNRYGVDVFQVRTKNPIDLYTYDQWDKSTWKLHSGTNPTWNNPEIQIYEQNKPVESNNLTVGKEYTVKVKVHNDTNFKAEGVKITFKSANYGVGQKGVVWKFIGEDKRTVGAKSVVEAVTSWIPTITGHLCIMVDIYHPEDINMGNNQAQENTHVGPTKSPVLIPFEVQNPTDTTAVVFLELRQIAPAQGLLWSTQIVQPDPQRIPPKGMIDAAVLIDPEPADVEPGEQAEFALTGYLRGQAIGGVNFIIRKQ